jgi:shikimate kinase
MGSGKTTVGHALARRLGWPMIDTDAEIVHVTGMSIPDIFSTHGEAWFRAKESEVLSDCLRLETPAILSLGGGTVLSEHNRAVLRPWADVVWLRASLDTLTTRVGTGAGRPVLAGDPAGVLARLLGERGPVYAEVASVVVDVDDRPTRSVVSEVIRVLSSFRRP